MKQSKEMFGTDDWLAKEIERESRISAWDMDEGKEVRKRHEENCDARDEARKHQSFHQATQHTVTTREQKKKETGNLNDKPLNRTYKKIEPERLKIYVKEHPEATQQEMAEEFGCCNQAVSKALKRNKITQKKRRFVTKNRSRKK